MKLQIEETALLRFCFANIGFKLITVSFSQVQFSMFVLD